MLSLLEGYLNHADENENFSTPILKRRSLVIEEHGGKTTLTQTVLYESREARDAVLKTPMEQGVAMGYDRLAELLGSLR
jgi:hypothetical protein